jgi:hypothetical protein
MRDGEQIQDELQNDNAKNCHSELSEESAFEIGKKADSSAFGLGMTVNFEIAH